MMVRYFQAKPHIVEYRESPSGNRQPTFGDKIYRRKPKSKRFLLLSPNSLCILSTILSGSVIRPIPVSPQLKCPDSGPMNSIPSSCNCRTLRLTAGLFHMTEFIAGANKIILSKDKTNVLTKSSAMPCAALARMFAVAGAMQNKSAVLANSM